MYGRLKKEYKNGWVFVYEQTLYFLQHHSQSAAEVEVFYLISKT
jgi:hypothetical protein